MFRKFHVYLERDVLKNTNFSVGVYLNPLTNLYELGQYSLYQLLSNEALFYINHLYFLEKLSSKIIGIFDYTSLIENRKFPYKVIRR